MSKQSNESNCESTTGEMIYNQTTNEIQPSSTSNHNYEGVKDENVFSNQNKQTTWVSFLDKPDIKKEIDESVAINYHSQNYLDSIGLCYSSHDEVFKLHETVYSKTTLKNQITTCNWQTTNGVSQHLPMYQALLSVHLSIDCHQLWFILLR
jgi:hypothetical protein